MDKNSTEKNVGVVGPVHPNFHYTDPKSTKIITIHENNKFLRQPSEETSIEEVLELRLRERIEEAMKKDAWTECIGLAAIQIGVAKQYGFYKIPFHDGVELVNPVVISVRGGYIYNQEGCMSIPEKRFSVYRFNSIMFLNFDQSAEGRVMEVDGFEAVVVQHEIDHMHGILCTDIRPPVKVGRNEPCSCGSGKKFKKCCG